MLFEDAGEHLWPKVEKAIAEHGLDEEGVEHAPDLAERRNKAIQAMIDKGVVLEDAVEVMMQRGLWDDPATEIENGSAEDKRITEETTQSYRDWVAQHSATKLAS